MTPHTALSQIGGKVGSGYTVDLARITLWPDDRVWGYVVWGWAYLFAVHVPRPVEAVLILAALAPPCAVQCGVPPLTTPLVQPSRSHSRSGLAPAHPLLVKKCR